MTKYHQRLNADCKEPMLKLEPFANRRGCLLGRDTGTRKNMYSYVVYTYWYGNIHAIFDDSIQRWITTHDEPNFDALALGHRRLIHSFLKDQDPMVMPYEKLAEVGEWGYLEMVKRRVGGE